MTIRLTSARTAGLLALGCAIALLVSASSVFSALDRAAELARYVEAPTRVAEVGPDGVPALHYRVDGLDHRLALAPEAAVPEGRSPAVWYDPDAPERAVLVRDAGGITAMSQVFVFAGLLALFARRWWVTRRELR